MAEQAISLLWESEERTWRLCDGDVPVYFETFCCDEKEVVDNRTPDVNFVPVFPMIR